MNVACYSPADFQRQFDVSRETMDRLTAFHALLIKWNARINLISRRDAGEIWRRHLGDSAQLWALADVGVGHWVDFGAGAGFPGLVAAAFAPTDVRFSLIESDQRKAAFLGEAARLMGLDVQVVNERIEDLEPLGASVVSARALAPLDQLLGFTQKHRLPNGIALFPKGETVHKEIESAERTWQFEYLLHRSVTDPKGAIVQIGAVARA